MCAGPPPSPPLNLAPLTPQMDTAIATGHTVTVYLYGAWARRVDERAQQGDLLTISGKGVAVQPNPL